MTDESERLRYMDPDRDTLGSVAEELSATETPQQRLVREQWGVCGALVRGGTHICILPAGHPTSHDLSRDDAEMTRYDPGFAELLKRQMSELRDRADKAEAYVERLREENRSLMQTIRRVLRAEPVIER